MIDDEERPGALAVHEVPGTVNGSVLHPPHRLSNLSPSVSRSIWKMLNAVGPKNRPACQRNAGSRPSLISSPSLGEDRSTYDLNFSTAASRAAMLPETDAEPRSIGEPPHADVIHQTEQHKHRQ